MTSLDWPIKIDARRDFLERLNGLRLDGDASNAVTILACALAKGGGARAEQAAVAEELRSARFRVSYVDGEYRLHLEPADDERLTLLLDLLAVASSPGFQIRRCFNDGIWFSPPLRSARSKFCSQRCRNRFNYEMREQQARFVCADCNRICAIDEFSGLALDAEVAVPADVHAVEPLCTTCISRHHQEWTAYMTAAELLNGEPSAPALSSADADYVGAIHRLIAETLSTTGKPQSIKMIADYVTQRMEVRGRRPDLTVLGHMLRLPNRYKQVAKNIFVLQSSRDAKRKEEVGT